MQPSADTPPMAKGAWPRVQAITVTGGHWVARPVVRADDGRTIELHELGVIAGIGRARMARVVEQLEQSWVAHRGSYWRALPPPVPAGSAFPDRPDVNYWAPPPA